MKTFIDREVSQENLSLIKSILDKHGITFWLAWGTCLGAIREQNFIAHDNDIDLEAYQKDQHRVMALIPELEHQGFQVNTLRVKNTWFLQMNRKGVQIDIYFCKIAKIRYKKNESKRSGWLSSAAFLEGDFYSELDTIDFLGETYKVPKNPVSYLNYVYGSTWRQPIKEDIWGCHPDLYEAEKSIDTSVDLELRQETLKLIKLFFEKNNIKFCLAEKTCRDAVTQNALPSGYKSITLNAYIEDKDKIIAVLPELNQYEFKCIRYSSIRYFPIPIPQTIKISRKNELIEIKLVSAPEIFDKLKGYRWICGMQKITWDFFSQFDTIEFLGDTYCVPHNPKRYLDYLYGPIWQEPDFAQLPDDPNQKRIDLLDEVLTQETQVELPVKEPWLLNWPLNQVHYLNIMNNGDMLTIKALNQPIHKGMVVLVRLPNVHISDSFRKLLATLKSSVSLEERVQSIAQLSIQRVVEVRPDGKIRITTDMPGETDTWCTASNLMAQVITFHSRLGLDIPFDSKIIQFMTSAIMPVLRSGRPMRKSPVT